MLLSMRQRHPYSTQHQPHHRGRNVYQFYRGHKRRSAAKKESFTLKDAVLGGIFMGLAIWQGGPILASIYRTATMSPEERAAVESSAYYPNCDAARAAGVAPIRRGEPGYRQAMDGDYDGVACEPYM